MGVENGYVNGYHCYINIPTLYKSNNQNSVVYTNNRDEIDLNRSEMDNIELYDGVGIYFMLTVSTLNQYSNMRYDNKNCDLLRNGKFSTSKKLSFSTLT